MTNFGKKDWVAKSGFYTNRIRYNEMLKIFVAAFGFEIYFLQNKSWSSIPLKQKYYTERIRNLENENFLVKTFDIVLKPK